MNINWQKLFVSLTILALGLTLAGCGKTASDNGGGSSGLVPRSYTRTSDTVNDLEGLLNALNNVDDVIIALHTTITISDNVTLNIPVGKTLTVGENTTLNVNTEANVNIYGKLVVDNNSSLIVNGTLSVRPGATLTDPTEKLWAGDSNGSVVFYAGSNAENSTAAIGTGQVLDIRSGTVTLYNPTKVGTNNKIYEIDGAVVFKANAKDATWQTVKNHIVGQSSATITIDENSLDNPFATNISDDVEAGTTYTWNESSWLKAE
jgi:hypothetical protein